MTALLLSLILIFAPSVPDEAQEEKPTPEPPIELASPEAAVAFEEGIAQFARGEFADASKRFRAAKKGAKGDAKKRVVGYEKACKEAKKLPRVEKAIASAQWRKALADLTKIERALGAETPLEPHLEPLRETIHAELYFPLANFEGGAPAPENKVKGRRPDSATPNEDPQFIREGKGSLRWSAGNRAAFAGMAFGNLPLAAFDGARVADYPILDFWIYSTDEQFGKFTLYFGIEEEGPGQNIQATDLLKIRCFFHHITVNKPGWQQVRINLIKEIPKHHNVEWKDITGVSLLLIPPSKGKTIYLDSLRLERP